MKAIRKTNPKVYVYIDASNIRYACTKTLNFRIDFLKLLQYFKQKYPNLEEVRYYEGIAENDIEKQKEFKKMQRAGYIVCPLSRKAYSDSAVYRDVKCPHCNNVKRVCVLKKSIKLKSNVDVYLATDLLKVAYLTKKPILIILVSCDGDYAEMIKSAILTNNKVTIRALATPHVKPIAKNTLSTRLKQLRGQIERFGLNDISLIQDKIKTK